MQTILESTYDMQYTLIHVLEYIHIHIYSFLKQCRAKPNQDLTNLSNMPLWQHD